MVEVSNILLYPLPPPSPLSNYNTTYEDPKEQYHDTQALSGVWMAVWQLLLAMVVKAALTIFTFGMKVREKGRLAVPA